MTPVSSTRAQRPLLSCLPCRQKKRRCDREQPCSNCVLRRVECEYAPVGKPKHGMNVMSGIRVRTPSPRRESPGPATGSSRYASRSFQRRCDYTNSRLRHTDSVYDRLAYLEQAVFGNGQRSNQSTSSGGHRHVGRSPPKQTPPTFTPLGSCDDGDSPDNSAQYPAQMASKLPPEEQATVFIHYLGKMSHQHWIVMHVPSSKLLMANVYSTVKQGLTP